MLARTRDSLTSFAAVLAIAIVTLLLCTRFAHAAGPADPTVPVAVTVLGLPWQAWLAIGLGAFAGLRAIVDALLAFFKAEAPLTKTLVDDHIRDDLQLAHDKLDRIAASVNGLVDASKPPGGIRVLPGSGTAAVLVVLLLGAAGAGSLASCGGSQASRSATIGSVDTGLRAAVASLRTYERIQAEAVIAGARSLDDGKAGLAALRAKTTTAWRALDAALAALDAANTVNDDPSVKGAQAALNDAIAAIAALTGGTP